MTTALARDGIVGLLDSLKPAIAAALPKHVSADRIARIALTAVRSNPKLGACSQLSFLGSLLQASQLGLEVNTPLGHAYLVPYGAEAQLIIGYQGMMDLARRSGQVSTIYARAVYEGDEFEHEFGLEPKLKHVPRGESDTLTHVYAVARLTASGEPIFTVLSRAKVESFRARSRAKNNGPWVTDYDAMACKTAVRRLYTWLPRSAEMARAAVVDSDSHLDQELSPEVLDVLGHLPPEPIVPEGTPDGRRVKLGRSPEPKAEAPREPGEEG